MFKVSCNAYNQILSKYAQKCVLGLGCSFLHVQRSVSFSEDRAADITGALQLHNSLYISPSLFLPIFFLTSTLYLYILYIILSPSCPRASSFFVLVLKKKLGQAFYRTSLFAFIPTLSLKIAWLCFFFSILPNICWPGKKLTEWAILLSPPFYLFSWFSPFYLPSQVKRKRIPPISKLKAVCSHCFFMFNQLSVCPIWRRYAIYQGKLYYIQYNVVYEQTHKLQGGIITLIVLNRITAPLVFCLCESQKTGLVHTEGSKRRQVITFWSCEELHGQTHKVIIVSHRLALGSHFLLVLSPGELAGPAFYSFFFAFLTSAI